MTYADPTTLASNLHISACESPEHRNRGCAGQQRIANFFSGKGAANMNTTIRTLTLGAALLAIGLSLVRGKRPRSRRKAFWA